MPQRIRALRPVEVKKFEDLRDCLDRRVEIPPELRQRLRAFFQDYPIEDLRILEEHS